MLKVSALASLSLFFCGLSYREFVPLTLNTMTPAIADDFTASALVMWRTLAMNSARACIFHRFLFPFRLPSPRSVKRFHRGSRNAQFQMEGFCEWDQLVSLPHAMRHHTPLRVFIFETAVHSLSMRNYRQNNPTIILSDLVQ